MWKSLDKRVAAFLLEEASIEGSSVLKITHEAIANHLGTHREVITRMLRYFRARAWCGSPGAWSGSLMRTGCGSCRIEPRDAARSCAAALCFADQLCHGAHGAVDTPAAGLEQHMVISPKTVDVSMTPRSRRRTAPRRDGKGCRGRPSSRAA